MEVAHGLSENMQNDHVLIWFLRDQVGPGSHGAGGGPNGRLGPSRSFDWRTEKSSGLWNLAFLARGAEIMALSSGRGPTFYSPHTHPTPAHSEGIWLCSQSAKNVWCKAEHDGSGEGLEQWCLFLRRDFSGDSPETRQNWKCPVKVYDLWSCFSQLLNFFKQMKTNRKGNWCWNVSELIHVLKYTSWTLTDTDISSQTDTTRMRCSHCRKESI